MTDETVKPLPIEEPKTQETKPKKKKKTLIDELQELRAKVKELSNTSKEPVKQVSKPSPKKLYVERDQIVESSEDELQNIQEHSNYLYIPKDIWQERNSYIDKLKERKREYKESLNRTVQAYQTLKKNQVKLKPTFDLDYDEEAPPRQRARYADPYSQPSSILHPSAEYYTSPLTPQIAEKKPLNVYSQKMIQQNMADAPGKRSFGKPASLSLRDKIQK